MKRDYIFLAALACGVVLLPWLWVRYGTFWEIDRCHDHGRRWNDRTGSCAFSSAPGPGGSIDAPSAVGQG